MGRLALTIALCALPLLAWSAAQPAPSEVLAEYRADSLDRDGSRKSFCREKLSLALGDSGGFYASHLYIFSEKEHRWTCSLHAPDLSPFFGFTAGHYYLNLGAGLLAGRKRPEPDDPYAHSLPVSLEMPFLPCRNGNSLESLQGMAASVRIPSEDFSVKLSAFSSIKNRFLPDSIYSAPLYEYSFAAADRRTKRTGGYNEPVELTLFGAAAEVAVAEKIRIQGYWFRMGMRRMDGTAVLWDYHRKYPYTRATSRSGGCGFFAAYGDGYMRIFLELGIPYARGTNVYRNGRSTAGVLCGMKFSHPRLRISLTGKFTGNDFQAPLSAGRGYAERSWAFRFTLVPIRQLRLGTAFSGASCPVYWSRDSFSGMKREELFLDIRHKKLPACKARLIHVKKEKNGNSSGIRTSLGADYGLSGLFSISASGLAQKQAKRLSSRIGGGITWKYGNTARISLRCFRYHASSGNRVYASEMPFADSISSGRLVTRSTQTLTAGAVVRLAGTRFSCFTEFSLSPSPARCRRFEIQGRASF